MKDETARGQWRLPTMDRRRFLLVTTVGGAGAIALGACSSGDDESRSRSSEPSSSTSVKVSRLAPAERPTVRLPFGAFGFPSPFASNGGIGYNQMSLVYDTLLWKDSTGELLPWLAKRVMRSPDNLTYTFELRPGIKWADGRPFTVDDVLFTFRYYAQQEALPPPVIAQPPQGIAKVQATGASTIAITLSSPDTTFAEQIAGTTPMVPQHIWSKITDPTSPDDPAVLVGTGAYRVSSYKGDGSPLLYTANDQFFLGRPFVKRIEFNGVEDQFTALLSGATDSASGNGLRADILAPFTRDGSYGLITEKGATATALYWNLIKGGALADKRFRRACAMAIDRNDLVERLAGGNGQPGNAGFLGTENPYLASVKQYDVDVPGANALLDAAGYEKGSGDTRRGPDGAPLSYELLVDNLDIPVAELVSAALKTIGVDTRIKAVEAGPQLFGAKFSGGFDMVLLNYPGPSAGGPNSDPDLLRRVFSSKVPASLTGASGYVNPTFDALADQQRATFDEVERRSIVARMQKIIADDIPILALYSPDTTFVYRKQVLDQWYLTPGRNPIDIDNRHLFITGVKRGTEIRPIK